MKIKSIVVKSSVTEDDAINIKGGINALNSSIESSCTDCNCWWGNENVRKPSTPSKPSKSING